MAINLGDIKIGQKYEFPVFKEVIGTFTAPKSETLLLDGGEVNIYYDPIHTQKLRRDGPTPELHFSGYGNGGKLTLEVEAGKNYYFWSGSHGCMNSQSILLTSVNNLEIESISPPEGSVFEISGNGASDITFNQPVNFDSAFITILSKEVPVFPRKINASLNIEIKDQLWNLYKDGSITSEGQKFTLTIKGLKTDSSTLLNKDGTLVVNYLTCARPISLTNTQSPSVFRPIFKPEDKDSVVILTFDGELDSKPPVVEIHYGVAETGDLYIEKLRAEVEKNKIKLNLSGKKRGPKDMLRSGNIYPTISIKANRVIDSKGQIAFSEDKGAVGSFTIIMPYKA